MIFFLVCGLLLALAAAPSALAQSQELATSQQLRVVEPGTHPVYFSEYKLRSTIEQLNGELRQLKRDFVKHTTDIYFELKSDPNMGVNEEQAKRGDPTALALSLIGAEFADILVRRHIIQRRLAAGLKVAYVKFLPVRTLKRLMEKFPQNYGWLRNQNQADLRPRFPGAKESHFAKLYAMIEQRARLRAHDDAITLTADNIKRILNTVQLYLVERRLEPQATREQLNLVAHHASRIINYYLTELIDKAERARRQFRKSLEGAQKLVELAGDEEELVEFIDMVINTEALDIDLSRAANSLELPLTINEDMIDNLERKWIPKRVLESLNQDRRLLMFHQDKVRELVRLPVEADEVEVANWCAFIADHICRHSPFDDDQ